MSKKVLSFNCNEKEQFLEGINKFGILDFKRIAALIPTKSEAQVKEYIKHQIEKAGVFRVDNSEYVAAKPKQSESYLDMWIKVLKHKNSCPDRRINILATTMKLIGDLQVINGTPEHIKQCRDAYKTIGKLLKGGSYPPQLSDCFHDTTSKMALKILEAKMEGEIEYFSQYKNLSKDSSLNSLQTEIELTNTARTKRLKTASSSIFNPFDAPGNLLRSGYPTPRSNEPLVQCKIAPHRLNQKVTPPSTPAPAAASSSSSSSSSSGSSTSIINLDVSNNSKTPSANVVKTKAPNAPLNSEEVPSELNIEDSDELLRLIEHYSTC